MKKTTFALVLVLLLAFTGMASAVELQDPFVVDVSGYYGDSIGRYGGRLTVYGGAEGPKSFNPHLAAETSTTDVTDIVFEGLVTLDRITGEVIPQLAREYTISEDGTELTFYLRRGVQWHDGVEFTADDVIFSLDVIYAPDSQSNSRVGMHIDGQPVQYEKIDDYTVKITLPRVHSPIMYNMAFNIVPEHLLGEAFREGRYNETWTLASDPKSVVGTGAFMISSYRIDQETVLARNPNYYQFDDAGNRLPYLNQIVYKYYPNQETAVLAFFNGEFDYMSVPATHYTQFEDREPTSRWNIVEAGPNPGTSFIVFNQNPNAPMDDNVRSWFQDKRVRQAFAHAIDKETILELEMNGRGYLQDSPINMRNEFFLNPDIKTYEYDLDKAHQILEEAGYKLGADGVRRDPNGNPMEFELLTNSGVPIRQTIGELFQEDLADLGITVHFNMINFNVLVDKLMQNFEWDAIIIGLTGTFDPNGGANTWMSHGNLHMWHPLQESPATEWEARIDELFVAAQRTMDWEERRAHYYEFQEIVADQVPLLFTVNSQTNVAVRDHLRNAVPAPISGSMGSAWNWIWIDR